MEIKDNIFARQFETIVPEGLLIVEYSFQEKKIFLTKFNAPDSFSDEETIQQFFKAILDNISERNLKAVPASAIGRRFFVHDGIRPRHPFESTGHKPAATGP